MGISKPKNGKNNIALGNMQEIYASLDDKKFTKKQMSAVADLLRAAFVNGYNAYENVEIEKSEIISEIVFLRNQYSK